VDVSPASVSVHNVADARNSEYSLVDLYIIALGVQRQDNLDRGRLRYFGTMLTPS
jgi:hypothetical protein